MNTSALPRIILVALSVALITAGLLASPVAADTTTWSDSGSGEDVFIQACPAFDVTTSYTANRTFKVVSNSRGDQVVERLYVTFAGGLTNAATGHSLPYAGGFTRISDYSRNEVTVSDLALRFDVGTAGQFAVAIARVELDLAPDPAAIITTFMPHALQTGLCRVLGGAVAPQPQVAWYEERMFSDPPADRSVASYEERTFSGPSTNIRTNEADAMTPWTILDACDTSPPGQSC